MADTVAISALPEAVALQGDELLELVQSGANRRSTLAAVRGQTVIAFAHGDASPRTLFTATAGQRLVSIRLRIDTPFDGIGAALAIGDAADPDRWMATEASDPTEAGTYIATPDDVLTVDTEIRLTITRGDGTDQGAGVITITLL